MERALTSGATLKMSALDWKVDERRIYAVIAGEMSKITTDKSIVQRDTQSVLRVVGRRYKPVQNEEALNGSTASWGRGWPSTRPQGQCARVRWCGHSCACRARCAFTVQMMWFDRIY